MKCAFLLLFLTAVSSAQFAPDLEITAEPHHHLVLNNDQVRVFSVDVEPHSETLLHWHRHDYVYVTLGTTEIVNAVKGKDPATLKLQDGETHFSSASFEHIVSVPSERPFRNITIELLQDEKLRQTAASSDGDRGLEILQGGTKEVLFVKDGVRVSEVELQPKGILPLSSGSVLLVAVDKMNVLEGAPNAPHSSSSLVDLQAGGVRWVPAPHRRELYNAAAQSAKFILLEFP
jgi:hypothetical protein